MVDAMPEPKTEPIVPAPKTPRPAPVPARPDGPEGDADQYGWGL